MKGLRRPTVWWGGILMGSLAIAGCASTSLQQASAPSSEASADMATGNRAPASLPQDVAQKVAEPAMPQAQPQMVKTAQVAIKLPSVKAGLDRIRAIATQQRGDVIGLQDQAPTEPGLRHTAFLQLRIPQQNLDATLKALATLGSVESQSISAEDVSTQLVDYGARLRNLRNTEEMLLKIMNRSGSVGDVLKVAQELSNVRSSIEQIDAQLKDLQSRVAYSVVSVNLEEAVASVPQQQPLTVQLKDSWEQATHSVGGFTTGLLKLCLWLTAYSPYWVTLAIAAIFLYRHFHPSTEPTATVPSEPPTSSP